jgi:hypothetical protein
VGDVPQSGYIARQRRNDRRQTSKALIRAKALARRVTLVTTAGRDEPRALRVGQ